MTARDVTPPPPATPPPRAGRLSGADIVALLAAVLEEPAAADAVPREALPPDGARVLRDWLAHAPSLLRLYDGVDATGASFERVLLQTLDANDADAAAVARSVIGAVRAAPDLLATGRRLLAGYVVAHHRLAPAARPAEPQGLALFGRADPAADAGDDHPDREAA